MPRQFITLLATVLIAGASAAETTAQASFADPCDVRTTQRVVAVGDVHGAYGRFVEILRASGVIDGRARWSGGRAVLVQTGDVLDRGDDSRRVLDLLRRLEREAQRAGGRVYSLLGNHEVMRMIGDWRYVSAGEYAAFRTGDSVELRERAYDVVERVAAERARVEQRPHDEAGFRARFLEDVPLGWVEMRQAFGPAGDYGRWLRQRPAVVRINGVVFVHGGINAETAKLGCAAINAAIRRDVAGETPLDEALKLFPSTEAGPLWNRELAERTDPEFTPALAGILQALDAHAIVVGHTVAPGFRISPRFDGRVLQIDTGMLGGTHYPGGIPSALEIRGRTTTAIYVDRREALD